MLTTTEDTGYPVIVFQYAESIKREMSFDSSDGKLPYDSYGAGYGNPDNPDIGKGFIQKSSDSFDLWFLNSDGEKYGIFMSGKYVDIKGLRKTTAIDFSGWDGGSFSETLEGGETVPFSVSFDSQGRPTKIRDSDGNETTIKW